jgi:hypothetical protein
MNIMNGECEKCKLLTMMINDYKEMMIHMKHQNNTLVGILDTRNHQTKSMNTDEKLTTTLCDVLKSNNDTISDTYILAQLEGSYPAYTHIAQLLLKYIQNDSIIYNKRSNSFRFMDKYEIVTESYVLFFARVVDFFHVRIKKLVIDANENLTNSIDAKNRDIVDMEYSKDTNRINNLALLDKSSLEKLYLKYKLLTI